MKPQTIYKNYLLKIKKYFNELIAFKKSPHAIALGFSIGSLIAIFPTFGLAYFIGLGLLFIMPRINKIALFLGITFWNPFFLAPIYKYSLQLGNFILGDIPGYVFKFSFNSDIIRLSLRFVLGSLIISTAISITTYFSLLIALKLLQRNKNK